MWYDVVCAVKVWAEEAFVRLVRAVESGLAAGVRVVLARVGVFWLCTARVEGRQVCSRRALGRARVTRVTRVTNLWVEEVAMHLVLGCQGLAAALRRTAMNLVGGPGLLPRSALCARRRRLWPGCWLWLWLWLWLWPCAAGHALHQANGPALNHYRGPVDGVKGARLLATEQYHDAHPATSASESRSCA